MVAVAGGEVFERRMIMGGGGDFYPVKKVIEFQYIDDLQDLFHHYHHNGITHHCVHNGDEIIHCGCRTITGKTQHATNKPFIICMLHIPDITGIMEMELQLKECCPLRPSWYHIGSLRTICKRIYAKQVMAAL